MIRLPQLTDELDAKDLAEAYEGIKVVLNLNPPYPEYVDPWADLAAEEQEKARQAEPWRSSRWFYRALQFVRVVIPAKFTDTGKDVVFEIDGDPKKLWDLESREDFDPILTMWASNVWVAHRDERIRRAAKN